MSATNKELLASADAILRKLRAAAPTISPTEAVYTATNARRGAGYPVEPWLPTGRSGAFFIDRMLVTPMEALFETVKAHRAGLSRSMCVGTITRLVEVSDEAKQKGVVWMSDTPDEWKDHEEAVNRAHGEVLVHGLGIGMVAAAMLKKDDVQRLTVIERNPDIRALVEPALRAAPFIGLQRRLRVIECDAYEWFPDDGTTFDVVWSDIWPLISGENLAGYDRLRARFSRISKWHGCWVEKEVREREVVFALLSDIRDAMKSSTNGAEHMALRESGLRLLHAIGAL